MDERSAYLIVASASALIGAILVVLTISHAFAQRTRAQAARNSAVAGGVFATLLRNGVPAVASVGRRALDIAPFDRFCRRLVSLASERGLPCTAASIASLVCSMVAAMVVIGFAAGSPALGFVLAGFALSLASAWGASSSDRRRDDMRDQLPDALRAMAACFHAGFTLPQTFAQLEREAKGSLGRVFGQAASALSTGSTAREALDAMRSAADVPELSFVAVALEVQHQSGGSMQHVLDATGDMLKSELDLRRSLRVHTAQARLSARVVVAVTIGLVAALMALTDNFLGPFFESPLGLGLLAAAVGMQVAGILIVRRLLHVEVD